MRGAECAGIICRSEAETFPLLQMRHWGAAPQSSRIRSGQGDKTASKLKDRLAAVFPEFPSKFGPRTDGGNVPFPARH
jgi:hypothetical protein